MATSLNPSSSGIGGATSHGVPPTTGLNEARGVEALRLERVKRQPYRGEGVKVLSLRQAEKRKFKDGMERIYCMNHEKITKIMAGEMASEIPIEVLKTIYSMSDELVEKRSIVVLEYGGMYYFVTARIFTHEKGVEYTIVSVEEGDA